MDTLIKNAAWPKSWRVVGVALITAAGFTATQGRDDSGAFRTGERILFQGDSITDGGRHRDGNDLNHTMGQDYAYLVAARVGARFPQRQLTFLNRGISGNKVTDLQARWQKDTLELTPDVLSILVGVNDTSSAVDNRPPVVTVEDYEKTYEEIIQETLAALPKVRLILGEPFALDGGLRTKEHWPERQTDLQKRREVVARLAAKYKAPVAHYQKIFDDASQRAPSEYWLWDGIHPTYAGHQLMAEEWLRAFDEFYGEADTSIPSGNTSLDPAINTAITPVAKLEIDSYDWYKRHAEVLVLQHKLNPEIILIGDSITHFWAGEPSAENRNGPQAWQDTFGDRAVLNMGFGWDRTQNVLWRLENGEFEGVNPKVIVLNIGTNNFSKSRNARDNSPEEICAGIELICKRLRSRVPSSRIIVMGVFPRGFEAIDPRRAPIQALNQLLAKALAGQPNLTFLDIGPRMLEPDGSLSQETMFDGTHPGEKGYAIWGQALLAAGL